MGLIDLEDLAVVKDATYLPTRPRDRRHLLHHLLPTGPVRDRDGQTGLEHWGGGHGEPEAEREDERVRSDEHMEKQ